MLDDSSVEDQIFERLKQLANCSRLSLGWILKNRSALVESILSLIEKPHEAPSSWPVSGPEAGLRFR